MVRRGAPGSAAVQRAGDIRSRKYAVVRAEVSQAARMLFWMLMPEAVTIHSRPDADAWHPRDELQCAVCDSGLKLADRLPFASTRIA